MNVKFSIEGKEEEKPIKTGYVYYKRSSREFFIATSNGELVCLAGVNHGFRTIVINRELYEEVGFLNVEGTI